MSSANILRNENCLLFFLVVDYLIKIVPADPLDECVERSTDLF